MALHGLRVAGLFFLHICAARLPGFRESNQNTLLDRCHPLFQGVAGR